MLGRVAGDFQHQTKMGVPFEELKQTRWDLVRHNETCMQQAEAMWQTDEGYLFAVCGHEGGRQAYAIILNARWAPS